MISKGGWNVPFEEVATQEDGAPEHADKKIPGELASYCTNDNVQDYTLTGRNPKEPVYAMIIISSVQEASGVNTFMVDKVNTHIVNKDSIPTIRSLLIKLARISFIISTSLTMFPITLYLINPFPSFILLILARTYCTSS